MSLAQFLIIAVVSLGVAFPAVLLIPRARQSPEFDRVLWVATWGLGFLGAWNAPNYIDNAALKGIVIAGVELIPLVIGAAVGAVFLNGLLWIIDRFNPPLSDEMTEANGVDNEDGKTEPSNEQ